MRQVILNSGGPLMDVEVEQGGNVTCSWKDEKGEIVRSSFSVECLHDVEEHFQEIEQFLDVADEQACTNDFTDSIRNVIRAQVKLLAIVRAQLAK